MQYDNDRERLLDLYLTQPENEEQKARKYAMIDELELKLGIQKPRFEPTVEHGETDDLGNDFKWKRSQ